MIHFKLDGTEYEYDQNVLDLAEAIIIQVELGLTVKDFTLGQETLNPFALKGMVFLAKRRSGQAVRMQDITFDCMELIYSLRYVQPPGEAPNPTVSPLTPDGSDSGMTPVNAEPSTLESSPTTSESPLPA